MLSPMARARFVPLADVAAASILAGASRRARRLARADPAEAHIVVAPQDR